MGVEEHKKNAPQSIKCMVITVSDTRNESTDKSGQIMIDLLKQNGHEVIQYEIVKDEYDQIQQKIKEGGENPSVEAILLNGGTGITKRDTTYEAVENLLHKILPGFGEIFRMLSYTEDIGSAAMLSRAIAGIYQKKAVFSTPGSSGAVKLAMNKLIVPELGHIVRELNRQ